MSIKTLLIIVSVILLGSALTADDTPISTSANLQLFPKVAHPDGGGYIFAWVSNLEPHFEVYARAFDSDLENGSSEDDISTPTQADGHRLHAEVVSSIKETGQGTDYGAMVAWVDHKSDSVYVTRLSSDASRDFLPKQVHPTNPDWLYTPPQMCSDGDGGAYFVWVSRYTIDEDNYYDTLRVGRVHSDGTFDDDWDPLTISEDHPITLPRICEDGSNGAKIAWVEKINMFDKIFTKDIIVKSVLEGYSKFQINPYGDFRRSK